MKYKDILNDVLAGKEVRNTSHNNEYYQMGRDGTFYTNGGGKDSRHWTPGLHHYDQDTWEVKKNKPASYEDLEKTYHLPIEPKKPTLLQAIESGDIKPGTQVFLKNPHEEVGYNSNGYFYDLAGKVQDWSSEQWMCRDYEIVKPEPEILTIEKITDDFLGKRPQSTIPELIEKAEQNGILKELLRIKEAIRILQWLERKLEVHKERNEYIENVHKALKILQGDKD